MDANVHIAKHIIPRHHTSCPLLVLCGLHSGDSPPPAIYHKPLQPSFYPLSCRPNTKPLPSPAHPITVSRGETTTQIEVCQHNAVPDSENLFPSPRQRSPSLSSILRSGPRLRLTRTMASGNSSTAKTSHSTHLKKTSSSDVPGL